MSLLTHFLFFSHPGQVVFDEVHFGRFVTGYFTHEYFFDIHPPLGKLLIAGMGYIAGFKPGISFETIGNAFPDNTYVWLRLLPSLAGALIAPVIYLLLRELKFSKAMSWLAGILIVFESALLVQSRFMLLDAFLLLFGFVAFLLYARFHNTDKLRYLIGAFIFAGLSLSIKWTGLTFLGVIGLIEIIKILKNFTWQKFWRLFGVTALALIIYFSFFVIHFHLLYKSGQGDAFSSSEFQKTLQDSNYENDNTIDNWNSNPITKDLKKFIELNSTMLGSNSGLNATHPYSSKWYTWPFMQRPMFYWSDFTSADQAPDEKDHNDRIYLIGNPVIWWGSTFAMLYFILIALSELPSVLLKKKKTDKFMWILIGVYIASLLPFIGVSRVLFLYHYFTSLILAIIALAYLLDNLPNKKRIIIPFLALSIAAFIFFSPIIYGLTIPEWLYNLQAWFPSWR
ncbi:MAG: phospholipid carrier-dependent glycosyltransferase [Parcubacteria group bacterium]